MTTPKNVTPVSVPFGQSCIILDVRTGVEHAGVSLKQAHFHIPLGDFDAAAFIKNNNIDAARPVYVLCRSGKRATAAAEGIMAAGHDNVHVIDGGIIACEAAGIPVRKGEVMSLERQVRIVAGALVVTGVALGSLVSPWLYGLSAFVGCGLVFAGVTDWCGMAFVLAKAPWNRQLQQSPATASCATAACGLAPSPTVPQIVMPEGTTFYSPANGKPSPVHVHQLTKTGGSAGGCS